jgi:tryptophan synthase beta chain
MPEDLVNSYRTGGPLRHLRRALRQSETLMPLILELERQYERAKTDDSFWAEMHDLWKHYVGRPSPLYFAERLTAHLGGAKVYMKRDELNHTGAHKINNVLGQIILAAAWARRGSSPKPAQGSMGWRPPRSAPSSG